jgi:cytochrome c553
MPSLAGLPQPYIVAQMKQFREGTRPATVMHQIAKGYTEQQAELLAEYFARQTPER